MGHRLRRARFSSEVRPAAAEERGPEQDPIQLQSALAGVGYPASPDDLIQAAKGNGAPGEIVRMLDGMEDREYSGAQEVMRHWT